MTSVAIARRIVQQILRDRRTLALIVVAPPLVLALASAVLHAAGARPDGGAGCVPAIAVERTLEMTAFDRTAPTLLGITISVFTFLVAGISFVRERSQGTLERMLAAPVRRSDVVLGYLLGLSAVATAQVGLIAGTAVLVLDVPVAGSTPLLAATALLIAVPALTLGMLLSACARSELQLVQLIPIAILPQIFCSGLFPLEHMHPAVRALAGALPLGYGAAALRAVMVRGEGLSAIGVDLAAIGGFSALFVIANIRALRTVRSV